MRRSSGELCHTWRNYLALGALGPDLFYMLPDFANTKGCVIRQVIQWALDVWEEIDAEFIARWEKWIEPISTNASQLASQLTGGLSAQLGQVLNEFASAIMTAFKGLLATMGDWFGVLTSGPPQGYRGRGVLLERRLPLPQDLPVPVRALPAGPRGARQRR